jgi:hypothetical protein
MHSFAYIFCVLVALLAVAIRADDSVLVLNEANFDVALTDNRQLLVQFHTPTYVVTALYASPIV